MIRSKSIMKGVVRAKVISLDPVGIEKLEALRIQFPERKQNPDYFIARDAIYKEHSFRKKRTTWNFKVFTTMVACAIRKNFREAFEVLKFETAVNHNIVTDEGDALVADNMANTPARTKVDQTNGHITVGTGWTGTTPKQNTAVNTPTGSPEVMDTGYPVLKGTWGNTDDNVVQYRATFEAGDLNQTGIDEAGLGNNAVEASGDNLAYGQITPSVDVASTDTLQVDWEITFLGA
jgi:hypothetical protein